MAANGSPIQDHGDKEIKFYTPQGVKCRWGFAAADVNKCLKRVSKTCDGGHQGVWFDENGGMIVDEQAANMFPGDK